MIETFQTAAATPQTAVAQGRQKWNGKSSSVEPPELLQSEEEDSIEIINRAQTQTPYQNRIKPTPAEITRSQFQEIKI